MKILQKIVTLSIILFTASSVFAGENSFIRITSPENGDAAYVYDGSANINTVKYQFQGAVSEDCISVRAIWAPGSQKNIEKYVMNGYKKTPDLTVPVDDFTLKQYRKKSGYFEYNVSGSLDNLQFGSNYYRFIAKFSDGTTDYYDFEFFVYQASGGEKAKPVIYLYPSKTQKIKVTVKPEGGVTKSIPEYGKGWTVTATPEGVITDTKTKEEYPYLFWESADTNTEIDLSKGFVIKTSELKSFFEEKLAILGLNEKEIADFNEFWIPELEKGNKPYIFITFYSQERIDEEAPLKVTPKPDSVIRVYFEHKLLDEPIETETQELKPAVRSGFSVIEWGGKRYN